MRLFIQLALVCFGLWSVGWCRQETRSGTLNAYWGKSVTISFRQAFSRPPLVYAWIRGYDRRRRLRQKSLRITRVFSSYFTASIVSNKYFSGTKSFYYYYSARDYVEDITTAISGDGRSEDVAWSRPRDIFAPMITETSRNVYDIFGRTVYSSQLHQVLGDNTNFPVKNTYSSTMPLTVNVRCDTFNIDGSVTPFYGIGRMTVIARKVVSNGRPIHFVASQKCSSFGCGVPSKASVGYSGRDNEQAVAGSNLDVYAYEVHGNVVIILQGSNSTIPQDGGDGEVGSSGSGGSDFNDCGCEIFEDGESHNGHTGGQGYAGGSGRRGGRVSYPGGSSGHLRFYTKLLHGQISLTRSPGKAGRPAAHGYGGTGGPGGQGGCGCHCGFHIPCFGWSCSYSVSNCKRRGPTGPQGDNGRDGFQIYGIPAVGAQGPFGSALMRSDASVRQWFVNDDALLAMIERGGEVLFQRNSNEKAKNVFDFVLSVANRGSTVYTQAKEISGFIEQGFDFYGNSDNYALDKGWFYLDGRTSDLLRDAEELEESLNSVLASTQRDQNTARTIFEIVEAMVATNEVEMISEERDLRNKKAVYFKALKHTELTMQQQAEQILNLSSAVLRDARNGQNIDLFDLISGLMGTMLGVFTRNPLAAYDKSVQTVNQLREFGSQCSLPTISHLLRSIKTNIQFAFDSMSITENFDYATLNASAVPAIMKSDLAKNRGKIVQELHCAFQETTSQNALTMDRVLRDLFRDGEARIEIISELMNIVTKQKQIEHNRKFMAEIRTKAINNRDRTVTSVKMQAKSYMADLFLNLYHHQENLVMKYMYELSKSYQFESLWDYDVLQKFALSFSDENVVMNVGSLNGMVELNTIYRQLQDKRDQFIETMDSNPGPKHIFSAHWTFSEASHPEVIRQLRATGQATVTLDLDPDDPLSTSRCEKCFNGRMIALYIEIIGDRQPSHVPTTTHLMVSHQGDSRFIVPCAGGNVGTITLQQTPEDPDSGNVMSFDSSRLLSIEDVDDDDSALEEKFSDEGHQYCDGEATDFTGIKPCKSPYATYVITVPRSSDYDCPTRPSQARSGTNCREFDFSRLNEIRMYVKIRSWSNYPTDPTATASCD